MDLEQMLKERGKLKLHRIQQWLNEHKHDLSKYRSKITKSKTKKTQRAECQEYRRVHGKIQYEKVCMDFTFLHQNKFIF